MFPRLFVWIFFSFLVTFQGYLKCFLEHLIDNVVIGHADGRCPLDEAECNFIGCSSEVIQHRGEFSGSGHNNFFPFEGVNNRVLILELEPFGLNS